MKSKDPTIRKIDLLVLIIAFHFQN